MKTSTTNRSGWMIPAGLVLLSIMPAIGGATRLNDLANATEITAANQRFHAMPRTICVVSTCMLNRPCWFVRHCFAQHLARSSWFPP